MKEIAKVSNREKFIKAVKVLKSYGIEFKSTNPAGNFHEYKGEGKVEGVKVRVTAVETWHGSSMTLYSDQSNAINVLKQTPLENLLD